METTTHQNLNHPEKDELPSLKHILESATATRGRRQNEQTHKRDQKKETREDAQKENAGYVKSHIWRNGHCWGHGGKSTLGKRCSMAGGVRFEAAAAHGGCMSERGQP